MRGSAHLLRSAFHLLPAFCDSIPSPTYWVLLGLLTVLKSLPPQEQSSILQHTCAHLLSTGATFLKGLPPLLIHPSPSSLLYETTEIFLLCKVTTQLCSKSNGDDFLYLTSCIFQYCCLALLLKFLGSLGSHDNAPPWSLSTYLIAPSQYPPPIPLSLLAPQVLVFPRESSLAISPSHSVVLPG